jgi:prephenate dehydrogenase
MSTPQRFETVAIVGVGLIGGSIGLALAKRKLAKRVIGIGRRHETLERAKRLGCVSEIATSAAEGVSDADLAIVCTPVEHIVECVTEVGRHCPEKCLITDAGSTKAEWIGRAEAALLPRFSNNLPFVGSHPIAGGERSGPEAAEGDLFEGRVTVVTPTAATTPEVANAIAAFWQALGSRVLQMSPDEHDAALAYSSHLPHVVAAALAAATPASALLVTGTGWQDTTRIAAGDAELWRQIFLSNRVCTLKALADFEKVLTGFRAALDSADGAALTELLLEGKRRRDALGS